MNSIFSRHSICTMLVAFFVALGIVQAQQGFREVRIERLGFAAPGYFLLAPDAYDSLGFIDHTGHRIRKIYSGILSTLQSYGDTSLTHFLVTGTKTQFVRRNKSLEVTDTMRLNGAYGVDFHEGKIWTDSSYVVLGFDDRVVDMSKLVPGGKSDAVVRGAIIQERTFDGRVLFEWRSLEHIPVTDATEDVDLRQQRIDYIHVNSINRDANGDFIISCRHLDEVICVSKGNGAVLWRLGGAKSNGNQFTIIGDSVAGFSGFSHQHTAIITSRGTLMMYDNGNLKPAPRSSRVVEYSLDIPNRKATRVWQYLPIPRVYSSSMGSVQELENDNILIGYGLVDEPAGSALMAQEVTRSGTVVAEIYDNSGSTLASYRVMKTTMGMFGRYVQASGPGEIRFSTPDSTTYVSINLKRVAKPTGIVVERHSYAPKLITFVGNSHCGTLPLRWVVRLEDSDAVSGTMTFDVGSMANVEDPTKIRLLYRPAEGQAGFAPLEGAYVPNLRAFVLPTILKGEFMLAYLDCFDPIPVAPANGAVEVSVTPTLSWKVAALADSYDVQLSTTSDFASPVMTLTTRKVDTTLPALVNSQRYFWRVRKRYTNGPGPWSAPFNFTTQIGLCTAISPVIKGKDTLAILPNHVFKWTRAQGATTYRLTVSDFALEQPIVDVTTTADSFNIGTRLAPNARYVWTVRGINGAIQGRLTPKAFLVTAPDVVRLKLPDNDAFLPYAPSTQFTWEPAAGAVRYAMLVRSAKDSSILYRDTVVSTWVRVNSLPKNLPMLWQCRAIGRYGAGPQSQEYHFTLFYDAPLGRPVAIAPRGNDVPYGQGEVDFKWSSVLDANRYRLQVFDRKNISGAIIDTIVDGLKFMTAGFLPSTSYDWRVMAMNDRTLGPWSDTARFITMADTSSFGLLPTYPETEAVDVPTEGELRFTTSERYRRYEVQLSWDESFKPILATYPSTGGTATYSGLLKNARYFWRAVGIAEDESKTIGAYSMFTTQSPTVHVTDRGESAITVGSNADEIIIAGDVPASSRCRIYDLLGREIGTYELESSSSLQKLQPPFRGVVVVVITTPQDEPLWKGALHIR
ncbi:MAG: hypothetical protein FGM33_05355 [Candidatus Kapabacteria bacterium]|nr:hypothetical protein [Candidatus Kapabacteria bacterium]